MSLPEILTVAHLLSFCGGSEAADSKVPLKAAACGRIHDMGVSQNWEFFFGRPYTGDLMIFGAPDFWI